MEFRRKRGQHEVRPRPQRLQGERRGHVVHPRLQHERDDAYRHHPRQPVRWGPKLYYSGMQSCDTMSMMGERRYQEGETRQGPPGCPPGYCRGHEGHHDGGPARVGHHHLRRRPSATPTSQTSSCSELSRASWTAPPAGEQTSWLNDARHETWLPQRVPPSGHGDIRHLVREPQVEAPGRAEPMARAQPSTTRGRTRGQAEPVVITVKDGA